MSAQISLPNDTCFVASAAMPHSHLLEGVNRKTGNFSRYSHGRDPSGTSGLCRLRKTSERFENYLKRT